MRKSGKEILLQSAASRLMQNSYDESVRQTIHCDPQVWWDESLHGDPRKFIPRKKYL